MNILTRRNVTERGQKEKKIKCNDLNAVSVSWSKTMWMWKNGLGDIYNRSIHFPRNILFKSKQINH